MPEDQPASDAALSAQLVEAAGPASEAMLRVAATHAACMVISDAAHSLRRMSMVFEAATTAALAQSLRSGDATSGQGALSQAEQAMSAAIRVFSLTTAEAIKVAQETPPSAP